MALTRVAVGTAPRGIWTFCYQTGVANEELVLHCPDVPQVRPVPAFSFGELFEDVLNTDELIYVRTLGTGNRNTYQFIERALTNIWIYSELHSPLSNPLNWEIWKY